MPILGIETSCDDTALAIYCKKRGIFAEMMVTQAALHNRYGGVVPELASRDHLRQILPLLEALLEKAGLRVEDLTGIAYTAGPGLLGAVMVGAAFGRALAMALDIPSIGIHHIEGHLLSVMLTDKPPAFPFIGLIVSGGHTLLVEVKSIGEYRLLGASLDDAAGEAFDKTAKLMGLNYPGGPEIEALAKSGRPILNFPQPMIHRSGFDFSFSGLKSHVSRVWEKSQKTQQDKADIAYALQVAITETLLTKAKSAMQACAMSRLVVVGGVSANQFMRERFIEEMASLHAEVIFPDKKHSTDNGAMIAYAGAMRLARGEFDNTLEIKARARWALDQI
jgi:N6-L-threonylcarbamoyladenine synthase